MITPKTLVTGATGMTGSYTVRLLLTDTNMVLPHYPSGPLHRVARFPARSLPLARAKPRR